MTAAEETPDLGARAVPQGGDSDDEVFAELEREIETLAEADAETSVHGIAGGRDAEDGLSAAFREYRSRRLAEIQAEAAARRGAENDGDRGKYREILDEKELLHTTAHEPKCVVHFAHKDFRRCKILDQHLEHLAAQHPDTLFVKADVMRTPFLVTKLGIKVLPCIMAFVSGVCKERLVGFEEFGNADTFSTAALEWRLGRAATLQFPPAYTIAADPRRVLRSFVGESDDADEGFLSWPIQGFFARGVIGKMGSAVVPDFQTLTLLLLVLNQMSTIMEMTLGMKLSQFRKTAYTATVASRGKADDWWTPYAEESANPPNINVKAPPRSLKERLQRWAVKMLMNRLLRKAARVVFASVPVFGIIFYAGISALPFAQSIHKPLFQAKHMSEQEIALWIEERQASYWTFGFTALLLERIPFFGIIFSISNRIGAAMWAHDLEKRQQRVRTGGVEPLRMENVRAELKDKLKEGDPGTYGHPDIADVDIPGNILQRPFGSGAANSSGAAATGTNTAPPLPRRPGMNA
ncbi:hypothetical protein MCUN1_003841 [Malassezia cuniculi]|uniref:Thioredoxin domain-containing protein n=1 Tax=Malassezia cuniculi TaxID=948313 RepID=A0AAF0EYT2_9BASI|nr:hypothetical protein MCUN1_003841 [Malassezia cuniculi]